MKQNLVVAGLTGLSLLLLVAIFVSPLWWVSLTAPNYPPEAFPDGVRIHFHMTGVFNGCRKVEKDEIQEVEALDCVHEMDTINHYVGMYPIAAGGVIERAFSPFLVSMLGVMLIVAAAIAAFASTGNAGILSASRYPLAMARDRLVSSRFGTLGRFHTPTFAIVVTGLLMIGSILFLDVEAIAKLASAFQLALFSLLCLAVIIMRESRIAGYDPGFRSPLYPWIQIVGFVTPFWLISEMGELAVLFTGGLITLTIGWYFVYGRARTVRAGAVFHTFARLGELQHAGLDAELRGIVKEKGLREEDPYDEVVARAAVLGMRCRGERACAVDEVGEFEDLVRLDAAQHVDDRQVPSIGVGAEAPPDVPGDDAERARRVSAAARDLGEVVGMDELVAVVAATEDVNRLTAVDPVEQDLEDALINIQEEHDALVENTEEMEIGLEKTDIRVAEAKLVWVPVA